MYKIKDDVDLKELEKFGFEEKIFCYARISHWSHYNETHISYKVDKSYILVDKRSRYIQVYYSLEFIDSEESKDSLVRNGICMEIKGVPEDLFSLIEAGLVEKV